MEKGQVDIIAGMLTEMKNAADDLERALKEKNEGKLNSAKRKLVDLQSKLDRMI